MPCSLQSSIWTHHDDGSWFQDFNTSHLKLTGSFCCNLHSLSSIYLILKQNDVQITKRTIDKTREAASGLIVKIEELTLYNERSLQELKKAKHVKQVQYYFATLLLQDNLVCSGCHLPSTVLHHYIHKNTSCSFLIYNSFPNFEVIFITIILLCKVLLLLSIQHEV